MPRRQVNRSHGELGRAVDALESTVGDFPILKAVGPELRAYPCAIGIDRPLD